VNLKYQFLTCEGLKLKGYRKEGENLLKKLPTKNMQMILVDDMHDLVKKYNLTSFKTLIRAKRR